MTTTCLCCEQFLCHFVALMPEHEGLAIIHSQISNWRELLDCSMWASKVEIIKNQSVLPLPKWIHYLVMFTLLIGYTEQVTLWSKKLHVEGTNL